MKKQYGVEIFGGLTFAIVFLALGVIGITEKSLTTGDPRTGIIHTASGHHAVGLGLAFCALGLASLGYLLRYSALQRLYWFFLAAIWLGVALIYGP
nr:hypothetical protein [uncultured Desulfuromonas sp.]